MSEEKKSEVLGQDQAVSDKELNDVVGGRFCILSGDDRVDPASELCVCISGGDGENGEENGKALKKIERCGCLISGNGDL